MLEIFYDLKPFFTDCYARISVRQYAKIRGISPPSASKVLQSYFREGILSREEDRRYLFFSANRENALFVDLSRAYWRQVFSKTGLLDAIAHTFRLPVVVLFGSYSKAEVTPQSDVDVAIFSPSRAHIDLSSFEKKLGHRVQVFSYRGLDDLKGTPELLHNILSGYILLGGW